MSIQSAIQRTLSKAATWLMTVETADQDPFLDPVFRSMSPRELADLPLARWPDEKEASPARVPERLKKNAGANGQSGPGPAEGWGGCSAGKTLRVCAVVIEVAGRDRLDRQHDQHIGGAEGVIHHAPSPTMAPRRR